MTTTFIGRCKGCGGRARIGVELEVRRVPFFNKTIARVRAIMPGGRRVDAGERTDRFFAQCLCGRGAEFKRLVGRTSGAKCNAKCEGSHGHVCECECGGANHGRAFA